MENKRSLVTNSFIELGEEQTGKGKGRYFQSRFIEAGIAHYDELGDILITKETLDKFIHTMVGCPVIINHKEVTDKNADKLRVGTISRVWFNDMDGWFYCEGILTDNQAIDLIKNQGWNVSCSYNFVSDNQKKTYHGKEINQEFIDGEFLHLAIVENPRYEGANIVVNSNDKNIKKAENGFVTLDEIDPLTGERKVIWIPAVTISGKVLERVKEVTKNYKQGDKTKFDFSHTRVKPTNDQIKYLENTLNEINKDYKFKGVAQLEISSELNKGSLGVCFSPDNTSLISLSPQLYNGKYSQERYDRGVEKGWNPKGTGDYIKSVLVHELGHAITCNSKDEKFWNKVETIRTDYLKNIKKTDIKNKDFISNYARTNKFEFVAEAFCQGTLSKKYGKYTEQIMKTIKEHFGKNVQQKLALNSKNEKNNDDMWIEGFGNGYPMDEETYEEWKKELKKEQKEEIKQDKANNSIEDKENKPMAVLEDLKSFILSVVNNEDEKEKEEKVEETEKEEIKNEEKEKEEIKEEKEEKAENKCKNEADEKEEKEDEKTENEDDEKELEEKEEIIKNEDEDEKEDKAENKKVKNSMDETKAMVMGGNSSVKSSSLYASQSERLELGNKF